MLVLKKEGLVLSVLALVLLLPYLYYHSFSLLVLFSLPLMLLLFANCWLQTWFLGNISSLAWLIFICYTNLFAYVLSSFVDI